jgi:hypothetical protein
MLAPDATKRPQAGGRRAHPSAAVAPLTNVVTPNDETQSLMQS